MSKSKSNLSVPLVVSWTAHLITVASGFIVPRLIDQQMGQELLGIWDLSWSLVSYCMLLEAGIGSSVNRHVALYLKDRDFNAVNRIVTSVAFFNRAMAFLILIFLGVLILIYPKIIGYAQPELVMQGRWVVGILGFSVVLNLTGAVYTGILTGLHRWSLHHGIYTFSNIISFIGMLLVLLSDKTSLLALALVHLCTELLGRILRIVACYRFYPDLKIKRTYFDMSTMRKMFGFGGRMFVGRMSKILMGQSVSVMIATFLGPATLAIFTRSRSLVRQASVFPQKYAFMLVPKSAALSSDSDKKKLQHFAISATRNALYMILPLVVFLTLNGGLLLSLWMGPDYANPILIGVLATGFAAEMVYEPLNNILFGQDLHGKPALASLFGAICVLAIVFSLLSAGVKNLISIALAIIIPWSLVHGAYIPVFACRKLKIPVKRFLLESWAQPLACVSPFVLALLAGRIIFSERGVLFELVISGLLGSSALLFSYYLWVIPQSWKEKLTTIRRQ